MKQGTLVPALESAHALAYAAKLARERDDEGLILVSLSGRGDKDVTAIAQLEGVSIATKVPA